jgi:hypothetical protein
MKFPAKMIIHTERVLPDETYFSEWLEEMAKTAIPMSVLEDLMKNGKAVWQTSDGVNTVQTTYTLEGK